MNLEFMQNKFFPAGPGIGSDPDPTPEETPLIPDARTNKEFYLSLLAGVYPKTKIYLAKPQTVYYKSPAATSSDDPTIAVKFNRIFADEHECDDFIDSYEFDGKPSLTASVNGELVYYSNINLLFDDEEHVYGAEIVSDFIKPGLNIVSVFLDVYARPPKPKNLTELYMANLILIDMPDIYVDDFLDIKDQVNDIPPRTRFQKFLKGIKDYYQDLDVSVVSVPEANTRKEIYYSFMAGVQPNKPFPKPKTLTEYFIARLAANMYGKADPYDFDLNDTKLVPIYENPSAQMSVEKHHEGKSGGFSYIDAHIVEMSEYLERYEEFGDPETVTLVNGVDISKTSLADNCRVDNATWDGALNNMETSSDLILTIISSGVADDPLYQSLIGETVDIKIMAKVYAERTPRTRLQAFLDAIYNHMSENDEGGGSPKSSGGR